MGKLEPTTETPKTPGLYKLDTSWGRFTVLVDEDGYVTSQDHGEEWVDHLNDLQGLPVTWRGPLNKCSGKI